MMAMRTRVWLRMKAQAQPLFKRGILIRHLRPTAFTGMLVVMSAGCAVLPFYTSRNARLPANGQVMQTRARTTLRSEDLPDGIFVGVAVSGGGSRAANFSAAAFFELEKLGVLPDRVAAISSVSGGSVTAAYYGLFAEDDTKWNPAHVRELLRHNFERSWIARWFWPQNILRYWFTDFNRSEIMRAVFDTVLFEGKTFAKMPPKGPRILLNATSLGESGLPFVFSEEKFRNRGSRLDTYPVASAVMASAAFPGAFTSVTLTEYTGDRHYLHVYDGGPADNLGIGTLKDIAEELEAQDRGGREGGRVRGCFLFIIDSYTFNVKNAIRARDRRDPRGFIDFFLDRDVLDATGVLLAKNRERLLEEIGIDHAELRPYGNFRLRGATQDAAMECHVWVLTFGRLRRLASRTSGAEKGDLSDTVRLVNEIETRFLLKGPEGAKPEQLQEALYHAANVLIWRDQESLQEACAWFSKHQVALRGCAAE